MLCIVCIIYLSGGGLGCENPSSCNKLFRKARLRSSPIQDFPWRCPVVDKESIIMDYGGHLGSETRHGVLAGPEGRRSFIRPCRELENNVCSNAMNIKTLGVCVCVGGVRCVCVGCVWGGGGDSRINPVKP